MITYRLLKKNVIAREGLDLLGKQFSISENEKDPQGILVRSAKVNTDSYASLLAVARAGAGVNNITVDQATERMKNAGVRLLFVINQSYEILGILTSQDILEERIVTHMNTHNIRREEITARDLMTPQSQVEVLQMYDVARATVGDIIKTFRQMGRQHALVVEEIEGKQTIRGILSTTQIAKQTGIHVDTSQYAGSFAELQASIS